MVWTVGANWSWCAWTLRRLWIWDSWGILAFQNFWLTSVVRYLEYITRGELLSLTMVVLCWGLVGHRTKDISQKTHKSTFRADYKAIFLSMMTAACLFLFQEKLLRLPERWTSLGPCTTSDSLPLPSFIMSQSALKCQTWAVCTTPRGHLWELVWWSSHAEKLGRMSASVGAQQRFFWKHLLSLSHVLNMGLSAKASATPCKISYASSWKKKKKIACLKSLNYCSHFPNFSCVSSVCVCGWALQLWIVEVCRAPAPARRAGSPSPLGKQ